MKIKQLKKLLEQFDEDQTVMIANYSEEDSEGNMPCHTIEGAEPLPISMGKKPIVGIYFHSK